MFATIQRKGEERLTEFHPFSKFAYFAAILIFTMFSQSLSAAAISLAGALAALAFTENFRKFLSCFGFCAAMTAASAITNPLFSHRGATPLFFINDSPVTLEAVVYGIYLGLMISAVIMWFTLLNRLIGNDEILYLFSAVSPKIALVITMILGLVPRLTRKFREISDAQKGSGIYTSESRADKIRFGSGIFTALLGWSMESSIETSMSMKARGFGLHRRTLAAKRRFCAADIALLAAAVLLFVVLTAETANGVFEWQFYPELLLPEFRFSVELPAFVLSFLPFILIGKEKILWKFYLAKI